MVTFIASHARDIYESSGLHGPLLKTMHKYLVDLGYTDHDLLTEVCNGMLARCVLPRIGLWPEHNK